MNHPIKLVSLRVGIYIRSTQMAYRDYNDISVLKMPPHGQLARPLMALIPLLMTLLRWQKRPIKFSSSVVLITASKLSLGIGLILLGQRPSSVSSESYLALGNPSPLSNLEVVN